MDDEEIDVIVPLRPLATTVCSIPVFFDMPPFFTGLAVVF